MYKPKKEVFLNLSALSASFNEWSLSTYFKILLNEPSLERDLYSSRKSATELLYKYTLARFMPQVRK